MRKKASFDRMAMFSPHRLLDYIQRCLPDEVLALHRENEELLFAECARAYCVYGLYFDFPAAEDSLRLTCVFDLTVPPRAHRSIETLICRINNVLVMGHMGLDCGSGLVSYHHAAPAWMYRTAKEELLRQYVKSAVDSCERFYPAFQFVLRGEADAEHALAMTLMETEGEA